MTTPIEARFASLMILLCDALQLPLGQRQPEHVLAAIAKLNERADNNPCKSCGADPSRYPDSSEEMPIVRGALDEQARVEEKYFAERLRANALRDNLTAARRTLAAMQSEPHPGFEPHSVAMRLWGEAEANLLFPKEP